MIIAPPHLHFHSTAIIHGRRRTTTTTKSSIHHNTTNQNQEEEENPQFLRKHNSKSTTLLIRRLTQQHQHQHHQEEEEEEETPEEKVRLLELSLVKRRSPQFSGSIYLPSHPDSSSPPPLTRLFPRGELHDVDNDSMLRQALEIRRNVTCEILKDSLRAAKFSITYSTNLVAFMPDFVDHVMIGAASLSLTPEFSGSTFNARAKAFIHNSNLLPLIRWLKHHSLTYPQIGRLVCMSCADVDAIRRSLEWLKTIYIKGNFLGIVLVKAGKGVLQRTTHELDEIVDYLESNGIRRDWMGFVVSRCPQILSFTMEQVRSRVSFYMDMGMNNKDFGTMVFDYPKSFGSLTLEEMSCKVNYLKEFGLTNEEVGRLLAFKPQLIACSIEERWKPLVKYLYYLGIRRDGMKRMLMLKPMVFCVDLETTIAPKVRFLRDIGIREDAIGKMLVKFPPLLTYSLNKKIRPVVIFLMTYAGVTQKDIGKVVALGPELLGCHIVHKLEVNVRYFISLGIGLQLLGEMIADFPMLLRYSLEVLRPKYRYLRRTMVRPLQDLIEFPRFFSYSLEGRIVPRHTIVVEKRLNFRLRYMLACSDEEFDKRVETAVEKRRQFESGCVDASLSSSEAANDCIETAEDDDLREVTCQEVLLQSSSDCSL